jgi:hypothetical protein
MGASTRLLRYPESTKITNLCLKSDDELSNRLAIRTSVQFLTSPVVCITLTAVKRAFARQDVECSEIVVLLGGRCAGRGWVSSARETSSVIRSQFDYGGSPVGISSIIRRRIASAGLSCPLVLAYTHHMLSSDIKVTYLYK